MSHAKTLLHLLGFPDDPERYQVIIQLIAQAHQEGKEDRWQPFRSGAKERSATYKLAMVTTAEHFGLDEDALWTLCRLAYKAGKRSVTTQ